MLGLFRRLVPERSFVRLMYHKCWAVLAAVYFRFPSTRLKVIAVTGTSGKSTTVELIHYLLQSSGHSCGAISTINFRFGEEVLPNSTLRTSLRPWILQKMLRKMVSKKLEYCVIEVSSHALDQFRVWGVDIDVAVLTNVRDNEHLDYHGTFADYLKTKMTLFSKLNTTFRKPGMQKISVLNRDDPRFEMFWKIPVDRRLSFSVKKAADVRASDVQLSASGTTFSLHLPNHTVKVETPLIGEHNLENLLAAIAVAVRFGVSVGDLKRLLKDFSGVGGRLEVVEGDHDFSVLVDFSYKPAALEAVLTTLKDLSSGRIIVVWGGVGGRARKNYELCAAVLDKFADEIVLTTDDPYDTDPKKIAGIIRGVIAREEGDGFFEIEDRYEAIRYAVFTAEKGDIVLVAGRGHEKVQTIGDKKIPFEDKEVCGEILGRK